MGAGEGRRSARVLKLEPVLGRLIAASHVLFLPSLCACLELTLEKRCFLCPIHNRL